MSQTDQIAEYEARLKSMEATLKEYEEILANSKLPPSEQFRHRIADLQESHRRVHDRLRHLQQDAATTWQADGGGAALLGICDAIGARINALTED